MPLKLYNTLSRKKEVFKPLRPPRVTLYDCGPTVYFYAHIGNLWRYLVSDFLRRTLEYNGYPVKQVMNITDVGHLTEDDLLAADTGEDKIVRQAQKEKKTPQEIAEFYRQAFLKDRQRLNMLTPHLVPKATDHIQEMIALIKKLEQKGYAYWAGDKYFVYDIAKFKGYGKLSGKKLKELKSGARLEPVPGKKNPFDFALWIRDPQHLMKWESPWGEGYPGWHIECSAMSMRYLGPTFDLHTGGEDNIFPHHENEIAQSEAATGKPFVRYWLHVRHNLVAGKKMSKSKGNLYLLEDLIKRGFDPLAYRYLALTTHYRSKFNFSWESLEAASVALQKLQEITAELQAKRPEKEGENSRRAKKYQKEFLDSLNDDLNTPQALAITWQLLKDAEVPAKEKYRLLLDFDRVLGLELAQIKALKIPLRIQKLVQEREKYRREQNFAKADQIRKMVEELGFKIEDAQNGPQIKERKLRPLTR